MIKDYSIIHIGPIPPPIGGISNYLYRLSKLNPDYIFINENELSKWKFLSLFKQKQKHFYYHSPSLKKRLFMWILCTVTDNRFSLVIHGDSLKDSYLQGNILIRFLTKNMLRKASSIQVVNSGIAEFIRNEIKIELSNITIQHSFLSPPPEDEKKILESYQGEIPKFINNHKPLIIANGASIVFKEGVDLYGLDMCIELVARLKPEYPDIGLLFALADLNDQDYFDLITKRIQSLGISDHIFFMTGQKELWPLFKQADLMVRPTYNDGYGISIAEALYFGCPAVASDVCERPVGTVLFKNRDIKDFINNCLQVLKRVKYELHNM